jgi:hypothetical protein
VVIDKVVSPGGIGQAVHLNVTDYHRQPWLIEIAKKVNDPHIQYAKSDRSDTG